MKATLRQRSTLVVAAVAPLIALAACGGDGGGGTAGGDGECGSASLRLSHQWPAASGGEDGDFRAELAQQFADKVEERRSCDRASHRPWPGAG